jgi:hypothetical protein
MKLSTEELVRLTVTALLQHTGEKPGDISKSTGLSQTQISRKRGGQRGWSLDDLDLLAEHYGITVADLVQGPTHAVQSLPPDRAKLILTPPEEQPEDAQQPLPQQETPAGPADEETTAPVADAAEVELAEAQPVIRADADMHDGRYVQGPPAPCALCGKPTPYRAAGKPQHLGSFCTPVPGPHQQTDPQPQDSVGASGEVAAPQEGDAVLVAASEPPQQEAAAETTGPAPVQRTEAEQQQTASPSRARTRTERETVAREELIGMVARRVETELQEQGGDLEAAQAALIKTAIADFMTLFDKSRVGARYEHTVVVRGLEILSKPSIKGADAIWEARPNWNNSHIAKQIKGGAGPFTVSKLDVNAAYLAAFKAHLPIGKLEHDQSGIYDPRKSGVYLITPPAWEHGQLPNPMGARKEPGKVWVTVSTLRLLLRIAEKHKDLCEAPVIHEAYVSGSTENILEKARRALAEARGIALSRGDDVTVEYLKAMYSKFVSTAGESSANRDIMRPDWMHIIRSQAFANLWWKALKAHQAGLTVFRMRGTDELHLIGDWHPVFSEGRSLSEIECKLTYTVGE